MHTRLRLAVYLLDLRVSRAHALELRQIHVSVGLRVLELLLQHRGKLLPLLRRGNKVSIAVNEIVQNLLVSGLLIQEEPLIPCPSVALPLGAALQMRRVRGPVVQSLHARVVQPGNVVRFPGGVVCRLSRVGVSRAQAEGFGI